MRWSHCWWRVSSQQSKQSHRTRITNWLRGDKRDYLTCLFRNEIYFFIRASLTLSRALLLLTPAGLNGLRSKDQDPVFELRRQVVNLTPSLLPTPDHVVEDSHV